MLLKICEQWENRERERERKKDEWIRYILSKRIVLSHVSNSPNKLIHYIGIYVLNRHIHIGLCMCSTIAITLKMDSISGIFKMVISITEIDKNSGYIQKKRKENPK